MACAVSSSPVAANPGSASINPASGARPHAANTGGAEEITPNAANTRSWPLSTGSANTGTAPRVPGTAPGTTSASVSDSITASGKRPEPVVVQLVSVSVRVSDSARRTLASETATRSPITRSDRPCSRRSTIVAITSRVSLEARRGPVRCGTSALTPAADSACAHRHTVSGEVSNAAATCTWVAASIRISDTAANRRPAVSPAPQAKDRFPCTYTRPLS